MKATVKCEYCQSVVDAGERYCPSCGSPLPEAPSQPPSGVQAQPVNRRARAGVLLLLLLALLGAGWLTVSLFSMAGGGRNSGGLTAALNAIEENPADTDSYQVVITSYLEQSQTELASNYAFLLVEQAPGEETGSWCVEAFRSYGRESEAVRLALLSDALSGESSLFPLVADTTLDALMPTSPLRQALELLLGKSAGLITLADLQDITYLSIGSEDPLSGGRTVAIGYDPAGTDAGAVSFQVEGGSLSDGLGLFCFQGLLRLEVREKQVGPEELLLPSLTALTTGSGTLTDLTALSSLTGLEELTILHCPLTSLSGVDALPSLKSLNLTGTVSTLPNAKGDLYVQMGILRSQVNVRDLERVEESAVSGPGLPREKTGSGKIKMSKSFSVSPEINLIGMTTDEAMPVLDKYLDDAYLAHLKSVRIVHGKGTGALRKAVQNHLRRQKYIAEFHLGEFGEGDSGVTIVTFK